MMDPASLARPLRALDRTVLMLQTELRHGRVDEGLLADIEAQMERGLASDPRCGALPALVDVLRESLLAPRPELLSDGIRAGERLRSAIQGVLAAVR